MAHSILCLRSSYRHLAFELLESRSLLSAYAVLGRSLEPPFTFGAAAEFSTESPPAPLITAAEASRFQSLDDLRQYLVDRAVDTWRYQFGQEVVVPPLAGDCRYFNCCEGLIWDGHTIELPPDPRWSESDGQYTYRLSEGKLDILAGDGADAEFLASIPLDGRPISVHLAGDRVVALNVWQMPDRFGTRLTVIDVADRSAPRVVQHTDIEGTDPEVGLVDDVLYLTFGFGWTAQGPLRLPAPSQPGDAPAAQRFVYETEEQYVARIRDTIFDDLLPDFQAYGPDGRLTRAGALLDATDIYRPEVPATEMRAVVAFDLSSDVPGPAGTVALTGTFNGRVFQDGDKLFLFGGRGWGDNVRVCIAEIRLDAATRSADYVAFAELPGVFHAAYSGGAAGDLCLALTEGFPTTLLLLKQEGRGLAVVDKVEHVDWTESEYWARFLAEGGTVDGIEPVVPEQVADLASQFHGAMLAFGDEVFFGAAGLWKTDGSAGGTVLVKDLPGGAMPCEFLQVGNRFFFVTQSSPTASPALWLSDGTAEGTIKLRDFAANGYDSTTGSLMSVGDTLYFSAYDPDAGQAVWRSDGTPDGTRRIADRPGFRLLAATGDAAYLLLKEDGVHSLWRTDGSGDDALVLVKSFVGFPGGFGLAAAVDGKLLFVQSDMARGPTLWTSDGSEAGTVPVALDRVPWVGSFMPVGHQLFFMADSNELWVTDGSAAGTRQLFQAGTYLAPKFEVDGKLCFYLLRGHQVEIWTSDGTIEGTQLVQPIAPGPVLIYHRPINLHGNLITGGHDNDLGGKLWILPDVFPPPPATETPPEAASPDADATAVQSAVGIELAAALPTDSESPRAPETTPVDPPQAESAPAPLAPPEFVLVNPHVLAPIESDSDSGDDEPPAALRAVAPLECRDSRGSPHPKEA